jgi:protein-disulfide isomerase
MVSKAKNMTDTPMTPSAHILSSQPSSSGSNSYGSVVLSLVILAATVANISASWWIAENSKKAASDNTALLSSKMAENADAAQLLQFGSAENVGLYRQFQATQAPKIKEQILSQIAQAGGTPTDAGSTPSAPVAAKKLTDDQYKAMFANAYVEGKTDAKITLAEFSDLECPACIYHHGQGVVKSLLKTYATDVNFVLRPIVLANHPNAIPKSIAALCVGKIAGAKSFAEFYNTIFTNSANAVTSLDTLVPLAAALKVDAAKFKKCYDTRETEAAFLSVRALSDDLGVNATPTTLIINNATKEYISVRWAADLASFEKEIKALLAAK